MANGNGKKKKNYNSYTFRNRSVDRITGPTRAEKKAKRDSIMKVARKNVESGRSKYGKATPERVVREAKRIIMEDRIKNTPGGQRFSQRNKARLTKRKKN